MKNMPIFPDCLTPVTAQLEFCRDAETVVYFFKGLPVFSHHVLDIHTFHMITAQFCVMGHAEEDDIVRAFGVEALGVRLAVDLYRDMGVDGFYPKSLPASAKTRARAGNKPRKSKAVKTVPFK